MNETRKIPRPYRRILAVALLALPLAGNARSQEAPRAARDPILFVHGWRGSSAQWRTMIDRFRADGWSDRELFTWDFDTGTSNTVVAARIATRVDQILAATGASRVDIVSHSMGALSSRYYLRELGGDRKVDAFVSIGAPNHGTSVADFCFSAACREMRPGSPFLAALNRGDETPGTPRYATWRSPCDEIVSPRDSPILEGAENHRTWCISHLRLLTDTTVYREVRDFVTGRPREYVTLPGARPLSR